MANNNYFFLSSITRIWSIAPCKVAIVTERTVKKGAMEEQDDALETISYSKNISRLETP